MSFRMFRRWTKEIGRVEVFELLHQVQQNEGLKFGNKISNSHVSFHRNKMNVRLAAQLFSSSVADSLEFLMLSECKEFENAHGTINFIRIIDKLFDLLNSKNPFGKRYKKPLRLADKCEWIDTFNSSIEYLSTLTDVNGTKLLCHRRRTFVLGFITAASSTKELA